MKFICLYTLCSHREDFDEQLPDKWYVQRYAAMGEYRYKCPKCGAAMAPEIFMIDSRGIPVLSGVVYQCFSECINAGTCMGYDQYAPDCEQPGLKQKCLHALFQEIEVVNDRLDGLEKALSHKISKKPVGLIKKGSDK